MSGRVLVGVKRVIDYAVKVTFFELFNSFFVFFLDVLVTRSLSCICTASLARQSISLFIYVFDCFVFGVQLKSCRQYADYSRD